MAKPFRALALVGLIAMGASSPAFAAEPGRSVGSEIQACSAAKVVLNDILGRSASRRMVLNNTVDSKQIIRWVGPDGYDLGGSNLSGGDKQEPSRWFSVKGDKAVSVNGPARATILAFLRANLRSGTRCEEVKQDALAKGVRLSAPSRPERHVRKGGLYSYTSTTFTLPVISPDGAEALAYVDSSSGPLAASGFLFLLRRDHDGTWKVAARLGLWIS